MGLDNYRAVLRNDVFTDALTHNLIIVVLSVLIQLPLGLAIALLLNRRMRGQGLLRTIIFVPYVLSEVIAAVVWLQLLQPQYGVVDTLLEAIGLQGPDQGWLGDPGLRALHRLRGADLEVPRPRGAALPRGSRASPSTSSRPPRWMAPAGGRSSAGSSRTRRGISKHDLSLSATCLREAEASLRRRQRGEGNRACPRAKVSAAPRSP